MSVFDEKPISYRCVVGSHGQCEMGVCQCECHGDLTGANNWYLPEEQSSCLREDAPEEVGGLLFRPDETREAQEKHALFISADKSTSIKIIHAKKDPHSCSYNSREYEGR